MTGLPLVLMLLVTAVMVVVVFRRLNLPPILGYLLVGVLIGPHAIGLASDTPQIKYLAEFGVVFLMFSIGLEFSLPKLSSMRTQVFGIGGTQVALTMLAAVGLALAGKAALIHAGLAWFNLSWQGALALAGAFAMSSTAIVSKLLVERLELEKPHGRAIMGVLLFQDLAVVPLLVLVPALGGAPEELPVKIGLALLKATALLALLLIFGQRLMRMWFHVIAKSRSQELFMLNLLLVALGMAYLTEVAGLSLALGAFVAGVLIAETEYRHQVEEDIAPFRDVLLGLFFITVGMQLDLSLVVLKWWLVLALLAVPVLLKFFLVAGICKLFKESSGTSIRSALALCTAGEFGFVLLAQAQTARLVEPALLQPVLAAMLISMMATPFLMAASDKIAMRFSTSEWMSQALNLTQIARTSIATEKPVLICGFGRSGQQLARLLKREGIDTIAMDLDPDRVREAAAAGESVVFGDAGRYETLVAAGLGRAAAVVVTYANTPSALKVLHHVKHHAPHVPVIVRTYDDADADKLRAAGATEVVPEILEGSLMLANHAMLLLGVPLRTVVDRVREMRDTRYALLRGVFRGADDVREDAVDAVRLHSVVLTPDAAAVNQRVADLGLELLGAEVTAIKHAGGMRAVAADEDMEHTLTAEDVLVLRGVPEALAMAEERLLKG
jgi:monovalent cation:H+ antiporter-2, CPA2 family